MIGNFGILKVFDLSYFVPQSQLLILLTARIIFGVLEAY